MARWYDGGQFGSFDGLDNRKTLMDLWHRLGAHLPEHEAAKQRQRFLQRLLGDSTTGLKNLQLQVTPCSAVEAYHLMIAITGCLNVPIETAARRLEKAVSQHT